MIAPFARKRSITNEVRSPFGKNAISAGILEKKVDFSSGYLLIASLVLQIDGDVFWQNGEAIP